MVISVAAGKMFSSLLLRCEYAPRGRVAPTGPKNTAPARRNAACAWSGRLARSPRRCSGRSLQWWTNPPAYELDFELTRSLSVEDEIDERDSMSTTWFITGTSSGFGRLLTERLLARGDGIARRPARRTRCASRCRALRREG